LFSGVAAGGVCSYKDGYYWPNMGSNIDLVKKPNNTVLVYPSDSNGVHIGGDGNYYSYKVVATSGNSFRAIRFTRDLPLQSESWVDVEYGGEMFFSNTEVSSRLVMSVVAPGLEDSVSLTVFTCKL